MCRVSRFSAFLRKNYNKGERDGDRKRGGRGREGREMKGGEREGLRGCVSVLRLDKMKGKKVRERTG